MQDRPLSKIFEPFIPISKIKKSWRYDMNYKYYFIRVADKQQVDFPVCVEIDIDQKWSDILHELDKEEHRSNEYQRRLGSRTTKNPARIAKAILGPEEMYFQKELEKQLEKAMMTLTSRQQFLIEAVVVDCRKQVDVAGELSISPVAVHQQLVSALKKLRKNF